MILIKGREMPKGCLNCFVKAAWCPAIRKRMKEASRSDRWIPENYRHDDCPLIEVSGWIPVTERLPECEWGAEVGNIEWISCGMVFAGCFGRGGKYRDAYFRTWTAGADGIDAKDADYWRQIQIPEPPKENDDG